MRSRIFRTRPRSRLLLLTICCGILVGCAGRDDASPEMALWQGSLPGGREVLPVDWDTLWRVGGSHGDTTLLRPFLLSADENGVYLYDGLAKRVSAYDSEGRMRWRFGRDGKGPDEFDKVRDMRASRNGGVDLLDPRNNRIMRLTSGGEVRARVPLSRVGAAEQMAPLSDGRFVLLTAHPESAFAVVDTTGALRGRFGVPWPGYGRLESLARQGMIAANDGRWVFAFSFGNGWFPYRELDSTDFFGRFVEHTEFPAVRPVSPTAGGGTRMDGFHACSACTVSLFGSHLYIHFGGYSALTQRVVDIYRIEDGEYQGSWALPVIARTVEVYGDRIYVLAENPHPELLVLRPRPLSNPVQGR